MSEDKPFGQASNVNVERIEVVEDILFGQAAK